MDISISNQRSYIYSIYKIFAVMYCFKSKIDLQVTKPELSLVKSSNPRPLEPEQSLLPGCLYSDNNLVSIWMMVADINVSLYPLVCQCVGPLTVSHMSMQSVAPDGHVSVSYCEEIHGIRKSL